MNMNMQRPKGWRKGQTIFNFLEWLYVKKEINSKLLFIQGIIDEKIKVFRVPKEQIKEQLQTLEFPKQSDSYDYLLGMKIYSFTEEKMKELEKELADMQTLLDDIKMKTEIKKIV